MARVRPTDHQRQVLESSCVTACGCMVMRALGEAPDEEALHLAGTGSPDRGRPLADLLKLSPALKGRSRYISNLTDGEARVELGDNNALAVMVTTFAWEAELRANGYAPPSVRNTLHAVLLIGIDTELGESLLVILDPGLDGNCPESRRPWVPIYLKFEGPRGGFVQRWIHRAEAVAFDLS